VVALSPPDGDSPTTYCPATASPAKRPAKRAAARESASPLLLRELTPAVVHTQTETAQRFLESAYTSVQGVLRSLEELRVNRGLGRSLRGRLTDNEEDLLRAALVFAGAGLDATLKRLIQDALAVLVQTNDAAEKEFKDFAERRLTAGEGTDPKALAHYLIAPDPRRRLVQDYVSAMTGGSLQSHQEVLRVTAAVGIDDRGLTQRITRLRAAFEARNEVSHELDLTLPERPGARGRRNRRIPDTTAHAHELLEVGQLVLNATAKLLSSPAS
jgi:hypothetical protein